MLDFVVLTNAFRIYTAFGSNLLVDFLLYRVKGKKNALQRQYVLPDGIKHKRGFVKEPEPVKPDKVSVLHSISLFMMIAKKSKLWRLWVLYI